MKVTLADSKGGRQNVKALDREGALSLKCLSRFSDEGLRVDPMTGKLALMVSQF